MHHRLTMLTLMAGIGMSAAAQAALHDRGGGLIYDDVLNVTWLADANYAQFELNVSGDDSRRDAIISAVNAAAPSWLGGHVMTTTDFNVLQWGDYTGIMTWYGAMAWADQLSYGGYSDWRLPSVTPLNGVNFDYDSLSFNGSTDLGYNNSAPGSAYPGSTASELAYMYYVNLGNKSIYDSLGAIQPGYGLVDDPLNPNDESLFNSRIFVPSYWTATPAGSMHAITFDTRVGIQWVMVKENVWYDDAKGYAWAVRPGDVAAVPEPETYALMLAGLGLVGLMARRRKRQSA